MSCVSLFQLLDIFLAMGKHLRCHNFAIYHTLQVVYHDEHKLLRLHAHLLCFRSAGFHGVPYYQPLDLYLIWLFKWKPRKEKVYISESQSTCIARLPRLSISHTCFEFRRYNVQWNLVLAVSDWLYSVHSIILRSHTYHHPNLRNTKRHFATILLGCKATYARPTQIFGN